MTHRRKLVEVIRVDVKLIAHVTIAAGAADVVRAHLLGVVRVARLHLGLGLKALVVGCGRAYAICLPDFFTSVSQF